MGSVLIAVGAALLLALGGAGVALPLVRARRVRAELEVAAAAAIGFAAVGDLALVLGLAGSLATPLAPLALLALAATGLVTGRSAWRRPLLPPATPVACLAALLVLLVLLAQAPTLFYDTLLYHFGSPVSWRAAGRIEYEPGIFHTGLPVAGEALFLAAVLLGSTPAAQVLNVLVAGALLAAVAGAAADGREGRGAALAACFLAGSPVFLELAFLPKSDPLAALFALLALVLLWGGGDLLLAGALLGAAASAKTTAAAVSLPAALLWLARRRPPGRGLAAFVLGAALALAPWAARDLVARLGGGPPSGAASLRPEARRMLLRDGSVPEGLAARLRSVAALPREVLWRGEGSVGRPGVIWLVAIPLGVWAARRDRGARAALVSGLVVLVARAWITRQPRFGLVGYAALAVAGGRGLSLALERAGPVRRALLVLALVLPAAHGLRQAGSVVFGLFAPHLVVLGRQGSEAYLDARLPAHPVVRWANRNLPADARVLLVGETRRAYLERASVVADVYHPNPLHLALAAGGGPEAAAALLRAQGIGYVLWNPAEEARLLGDDPFRLGVGGREVAAFLRAQAVLLHAERGVGLFALPAVRAPRPHEGGPPRRASRAPPRRARKRKRESPSARRTAR
jgi:hypothetical protein